jgi:short-subunit dehydrogenase
MTSGGSRHILITGASSGIGAELARQYARSGCTLSLTGRDQQRLDAVADACRRAGATVSTAVLDIIDAAALSDWLLQRDAALAVDLVIASAGSGGAQSIASAKGEDPGTARRIVEVNTIGTVNTVAPLVPLMAGRRRGQIAIMASVGGLLGLPHAPAYSASKAAVAIYGDSLRRLLLPLDVAVSVVYPGYVETPMSASLPFSRPLLWQCDRAASHIIAQLEKRRRSIAFPWLLYWPALAARWLPAALVDAVLAAQATRDLRDSQ